MGQGVNKDREGRRERDAEALRLRKTEAHPPTDQQTDRQTNWQNKTQRQRQRPRDPETQRPRFKKTFKTGMEK